MSNLKQDGYENAFFLSFTLSFFGLFLPSSLPPFLPSFVFLSFIFSLFLVVVVSFWYTDTRGRVCDVSMATQFISLKDSYICDILHFRDMKLVLVAVPYPPTFHHITVSRYDILQKKRAFFVLSVWIVWRGRSWVYGPLFWHATTRLFKGQGPSVGLYVCSYRLCMDSWKSQFSAGGRLESHLTLFLNTDALFVKGPLFSDTTTDVCKGVCPSVFLSRISIDDRKSYMTIGSYSYHL